MPLIVVENSLPRRLGQALRWFAKGDCAKQVADRMGIAHRTARGYATTLQYKLNARNTAHMVTRAFELGILKYTPVFLLCMSVAFGSISNVRPVRRPVQRPAAYSRILREYAA